MLGNAQIHTNTLNAEAVAEPDIELVAEAIPNLDMGLKEYASMVYKDLPLEEMARRKGTDVTTAGQNVSRLYAELKLDRRLKLRRQHIVRDAVTLLLEKGDTDVGMAPLDVKSAEATNAKVSLSQDELQAYARKVEELKPSLLGVLQAAEVHGFRNDDETRAAIARAVNLHPATVRSYISESHVQLGFPRAMPMSERADILRKAWEYVGSDRLSRDEAPAAREGSATDDDLADTLAKKISELPATRIDTLDRTLKAGRGGLTAVTQHFGISYTSLMHRLGRIYKALGVDDLLPSQRSELLQRGIVRYRSMQSMEARPVYSEPAQIRRPQEPVGIAQAVTPQEAPPVRFAPPVTTRLTDGDVLDGIYPMSILVKGDDPPDLLDSKIELMRTRGYAPEYVTTISSEDGLMTLFQVLFVRRRT